MTTGVLMVLLAGCASEPGVRTVVQYDFSVKPQGSDLVIIAPPGKQGVHDGGYVRIKLKSNIDHAITWECPGEISMEFKTMPWDDSTVATPDKGKLTKEYEDKSDPEKFSDPRKVIIHVSKKKLGKNDVAVYKYDITCAGISKDPVIIINR
jgi:hypothetical protein